VAVSEQLITAATSSVSIRQQSAQIVKGSDNWASLTLGIRKRRMDRADPTFATELRKNITKRRRLNGVRPSPQKTRKGVILQYLLGPTTPGFVLPKRDQVIELYLELKPHLRVYRMTPMSPTLMVLLSLAKYDANGFLTLLYFLYGPNSITQYAELLDLRTLQLEGEKDLVLYSAIDFNTLISKVRTPLQLILTAWARHQSPQQ
jgi:hypothetical protein